MMVSDDDDDDDDDDVEIARTTCVLPFGNFQHY